LIGTEKVLALITARGGSKGIPRKNLQELGGRPLIAWSIAAAKASRYIDKLIVSTDDDEIATTAQTYGAEIPFMRPPELALDETPGMDPVLHTLAKVHGYDWIVLLQPTSPLRLASDIDACLELCEATSAPCCVSVCAPEHNPYLALSVDAHQRMHPMHGWDMFNRRRQDLAEAFVLNGAVYTARVDWLIRNKSFISPETLAYIMPRERSVDIDTNTDLNLARSLLKEVRK